MATPPSQEDTATGSSSDISQNTSQPASRSILSFWGNQAGPSQPLPVAPAAPAKRKRKKAEDGPPQGRINLSTGGGTVWGVAKPGPELEVGSDQKGKGRAKTRGDGEEDELKEMTKRAKAMSRLQTKNKNKGSEGPGPPEDGDSAGPSGSTSTSPVKVPLKPRVSPSKRKQTIRPRRSANAQGATLAVIPPSPEIIHVPSSDPPQPTSPATPLASHPEKIGNRTAITLSRTHSTSSKGAVDDPIDIEEAQPKTGPRKLVFAADTKTAHSFFSKVSAGHVNSDRAGSVISESAVSEAIIKPKAHAANGKAGKAHAFFSMNGNKDVPGKEKSGWGHGVKEGQEWLVPLPGGLWPNHEIMAGPSNYQVTTGGTTLARRQYKTIISDVLEGNANGHEEWFQSTVTAEPSGRREASRDWLVQNLPPFISEHPAIRSVASRDISSSRETWAERYRPLSADQVLGNEIEATYLRDWLHELAVGGSSGEKRKIHRKVKRIKPQLFDGWIVDDAGLFGDPISEIAGEDEVEYNEYDEPNMPLGTRPTEYPALATAQLTNSILLTGPNGSGKSAAVYAAAAELGWEVFEVYPGMGKRTAASLMSWVGDVGKNHLVVKGGSHEKAPEKKDVIKSFFGKAKESKSAEVDDNDDDIVMLPGSQGSKADPIAIDQSPMKEDTLVLEANEAEHRIRQSLILIEEADIIFAEENTFWPAVMSLIAESRRPVIITCNDLNPIPLESLPLQCILHFQPPPSYIAIPYLEAIASRQDIKSEALGAELYRKRTYIQPYLQDDPLPPNGHEPLPYFDLRKALIQLQADRHAVSDAPPADGSSEYDLTKFAQTLEYRSWVDSMVLPGDWTTQELVETDRYDPTADDQLGLHLLVKPDIHDLYPIIPSYDASSSIANEIGKLAGTIDYSDVELSSERVHHVRSILPLLDPLIPLSAPLLPAPVLFTLYMPVLRNMIEWEDMLEIAEEEAVARGEGRINRKTGRPKRATVGGGQGYGRYLDSVDEEGLQAARDSKIRW